jgi:hypothetical protein
MTPRARPTSLNGQLARGPDHVADPEKAIPTRISDRDTPFAPVSPLREFTSPGAYLRAMENHEARTAKQEGLLTTPGRRRRRGGGDGGAGAKGRNQRTCVASPYWRGMA